MNGGGGGGGVIGIFFTEGFVGLEPAANQSTKGGDGQVPGDNGVIIINGMFGTLEHITFYFIPYREETSQSLKP